MGALKTAELSNGHFPSGEFGTPRAAVASVIAHLPAKDAILQRDNMQ